ncbi:MAG: nitronate monooxygenase [Verrucomicrobia bacterium]|nr:nitronate monooxygenase [Verrucomicrobiota bacterium]
MEKKLYKDGSHSLPAIIQGGMGVAVSNWQLARAVSRKGQMGVVSGTALDTVLIRRLQDGDADGAMRRAIAAFPCQKIGQAVLDKWYSSETRPVDKPYGLKPLPDIAMARREVELTILAGFVEIYLAKEGHEGWVGINLLEKIQMSILPTLLGTMLAGVDAVFVGGGIPVSIPPILSAFSRFEPAELKIHVQGASPEKDTRMHLNPAEYLPVYRARLSRPRFFPIVSSEVLAKSLVRKLGDAVDGLVVEHHRAGGHNAPPRRDQSYGPKDEYEPSRIAALGKPFWLDGGKASPEALQAAIATGAQGVQIGSAFACSEESGILKNIKNATIQAYLDGALKWVTDFKASPTGYPFKRVQFKGYADADDERPVCNLGYLRHAFEDAKGQIAYRCPAAVKKLFYAKGGDSKEAEGKICLCNSLLATVGLGQVNPDGSKRRPLLTLGEDLSFLDHLLSPPKLTYTVDDLIAYLTGGVPDATGI